MPRQRRSKKKTDPDDSLEQFARDIMPLIGKMLSGEDDPDVRIEARFRAGEPTTVKGKHTGKFAKLEADLDIVATFMHVRDAGGQRRRLHLTLTGPVLEKKTKKRSRRKAV